MQKVMIAFQWCAARQRVQAILYELRSEIDFFSGTIGSEGADIGLSTLFLYGRMCCSSPLQYFTGQSIR